MSNSLSIDHAQGVGRARQIVVDVESSLRLAEAQKDPNAEFEIRVVNLEDLQASHGQIGAVHKLCIQGQSMRSALLQELASAKERNQAATVIHLSKLTESPVAALSRKISDTFWTNLTRSIDAEGLEAILTDAKADPDAQPRIYVPAVETEMLKYYQELAMQKPNLNLQVVQLPKNFDAHYTRSLNDKAGILALALNKSESGEFEGIPFIVPGSRFNELYNWDSYFIALGLVVDNKVEIAKGIVDHFVFQIKHYGKVLNGNRSYYLSRSQPPFLTDFALQVYTRLDPKKSAESKAWLKNVIRAAIKEYHTVWMAEPRLDKKTGLTRYRPDGKGIPPECEPTHFDEILKPYADKKNLTIDQYKLLYNNDHIEEPELDEYLLHDRAVRESGHDTYRFEKHCGDIATIDLQALMYKYESDIAHIISHYFDDNFTLEEDFTLSAFPFGFEVHMLKQHASYKRQGGHSSLKGQQKAAEWQARAERRRQLMDHYLWNEDAGQYFDYNTKLNKQSTYETPTTFWAMWAGAASDHQAQKLVAQALPALEVGGGIVSSSAKSCNAARQGGLEKQWDYPNAWAPHQIMTWKAMERYGYKVEANRLAYRWCYMIVKAFVEEQGIVAEKLDAVAISHVVTAEYGNQGNAKEGFGWTNSSIQIALTFMTPALIDQLGKLVHPKDVFGDSKEASSSKVELAEGQTASRVA